MSSQLPIVRRHRKRPALHLLVGGLFVGCAIILAHGRPPSRVVGLAAPASLGVGVVVAVHLGVALAAAGALLARSRSRRRARRTGDARGATLHFPRLYDWFAAAHSWGTNARTLEVAGIASGENVLDVCCGTGTLALAAKRRVGARGSVQGVDASDDMIARARAKSARAGLPVTFVAGVAQALPFPDATFDVVLCTLALHHLPEAERARALQEMSRVVKPGGRVLIVEFRGSRGIRALLHPVALLHGRRTGQILESAAGCLRRSGWHVVVDVLGAGSLGYALASREAGAPADSPRPPEAAQAIGSPRDGRQRRSRGRPRVPWSEPQGRLRAGPLAVRVLGSGSPTLLLHGLLGSNRYWGAAFDRLASGGTLLVPDLLGFGASPRPPSGYGPEEHGRAVIASLRDLNVVEPLLVVGHSLGALVGMWLACSHPERVRGVIAFAPPLYRDAPHARRQIAKMGALHRVFGLQNRAATWVARLACRNLCSARPRLAARLYAAIRPALPPPLLEDATRHSWTSYSETLKRVILDAEGAKWVTAARPPIQIVVGTRDPYLDVEFVRELVDGRADRPLEVWSGQGHDLPLTQPERCLEVIDAWRRAPRCA